MSGGRSYYELLEKMARRDSWLGRDVLGMEYAMDGIEHESFDIPGIMVTSPTGRVLLIVEGRKEHVGPIIEKAREQFDALKEAFDPRDPEVNPIGAAKARAAAPTKEQP